MELTELLAFAVKNGASDIHLTAGLPPMIRIDGDIKRVKVDALDDKPTGWASLPASTAVARLYRATRHRELLHIFEGSRRVCNHGLPFDSLTKFRVTDFAACDVETSSATVVALVCSPVHQTDLLEIEL